MKEKSKLNFGLILTVYLLGIFMGALDTGIVTPARTVIQESLNVGDKAGIWMITVYTLSYAASIPVMGKLADRMGRRTIYLLSIFLFGGGSLFCGLSHGMNSFTALLIARAVQAVGGGGIMPVATAEFGTTFPEEKRGMALGMVGGVYGVANIFGASVGSAVMDFFGTGHWEFIFFVNVPIAVFILAAGFFCLPNTKEKSRDPIDGTGICVLVIMVLCIMYGLKNIDFFNFRETLQSTDVYPYLLIFLALLPIFVWIERRAVDPVMNLHYFSNPRILITLGVSIITGIVLMGVIFVPQLCENAMEVPSGKGGYFVIILGVFAGVGAPFSGRLTDRFGPRAVLGAGLIASILGSLTVIFSTTVDPGWPNVIAALMFIGLGIGFTMGAPLNYMMLWETDEREANSALATLSLVRSLGTVIAPAVMVGFIAHAGTGISDDVMKLMPKEVNVPRLPYAAELTKVMRSQGVENVPDFDSMTRIQIDMNASGGDTEIPEALLNELKNSDVTTITENTKDMARYMFEKMSPQIQTKIDRGISKGESGVRSGIRGMDQSIRRMREAESGMQQGIDGMNQALAKQSEALKKMKKGRASVHKGYQGVSKGVREMQKAYDAQRVPFVREKMKPQLEKLQKKQKELARAEKKMDRGIASLTAAQKKIRQKQARLKYQKAQMAKAITGIQEGKREAKDTLRKLKIMKKAVPGALAAAEKNYIKELDRRSPEIRQTYQSALNRGFRQVFIMTAIASGAGLLLLLMYRRRREESSSNE